MPSRLISTVASEIAPSNTSRKSFTIANTDTAETVFVKRERAEATTVSSTDFDFRLGPGSAVSLNSTTDGTQAIQARYTVVAGANTPRVSFFETEDIVR